MHVDRFAADRSSEVVLRPVAGMGGICTPQIADRQAGVLTASARTTTASLRADLENAKAGNRRLEVELSALRRRLGQLMGREVFDEISADTSPGATSRVAELEQALFDAKEALVRRSEEVESARQINRELMARLNRGS